MVLFTGVPGLQSPTLQGGFPIQNLQAALQSAGATVATPTSQGEYFLCKISQPGILSPTVHFSVFV